MFNRLNVVSKFCTRTVSVDGVIAYKRRDKAIIQFNRPNKLNAITSEIQVSLSNHLRDFETDPSVSAVIIKGNEVGFSAGGDLIQFAELLSTTDEASRKFYESNKLFYRGLLRLAEYRKPVITLCDGICMGGAAAVAFLSSHPVTTERTLFAMPEVFIGFYPNAGANYFVGRLPYNVGMWLGLTGRRFIGPEIVKIGLSKNYVLSKSINQLEDSLINLENANHESVSTLITSFQQIPDLSMWNVDLNAIEKIFSGNSLEQIIDNLRSDNSEFSNEILKLFSRLSPTALKMTFYLFRQFRLKNESVNDALSTDYGFFKSFFSDANLNDFREGIHSLLVDKKHKPNWIPKQLNQVNDKKMLSFLTNNIVDIRSSCM